MNILYTMGILNIMTLTSVVVSIIFLFRIIKRTEGKLREGYTVLFISLLVFLVFILMQALSNFDIVQSGTIPRAIFLLLFGFVFAIGVWRMGIMISHLVDTGSELVIVKGKNYRKIGSLLTDIHGVCYVALSRSAGEIKRLLKQQGINTETYYFIDASGSRCKEEECMMIKNGPETLKSAIRRILSEKKMKYLVVEGIQNIRGIKDFELPLLVQNISICAGQSHVKSFFIARKGSISEKIKKDISLLVDHLEE